MEPFIQGSQRVSGNEVDVAELQGQM